MKLTKRVCDRCNTELDPEHASNWHVPYIQRQRIVNTYYAKLRISINLSFINESEGGDADLCIPCQNVLAVDLLTDLLARLAVKKGVDKNLTAG